jgi:hypothetical protein
MFGKKQKTTINCKMGWKKIGLPMHMVGIEPKYPRFGKTNGHCTAHVVFGHKLHLLDDILDIGIRLHPPLKHKNL